jgi:AraC-like DNA-binding protein
MAADCMHSTQRTEIARYWRHAAVPGVDLLRARFVTHRYSRHAHETFTLGLIEAGVEEFEYGGSLLRAGRGGVALLNPEVVHTGQAAAPEGWAYRVLYPAVDVVTGVARELGWRTTPFFPETVVYDERSARLLLAAHVAAEHGDQLASSSLLRAGLAGLLLAHAGPHPAGRPPAPVRRAGHVVSASRDLLAERLTDPPSLDDLARAAGMSPFALLRAFRSETGLPPHAYLNQLRVRLARRLLDDGLAPAVVAAEAGFADQAHLTRHFKRVVGVPPGAYQRERGGTVGVRCGMTGVRAGGRTRPLICPGDCPG